MNDSIHVQVEVVKLHPIGVGLTDVHRNFDTIYLTRLKQNETAHWTDNIWDELSMVGNDYTAIKITGKWNKTNSSFNKRLDQLKCVGHIKTVSLNWF